MIFDELLEADLGLPAELAAGLRRIADEEVDLGRPLVAGVEPDVFFPVEPEERERLLENSRTLWVSFGRDDVVVRPVLLEHEPHHLHVLLGVAPVALGLEVAEEELVLEPDLDPGRGPGDFPGDEGLAPPGRLVVEEDAVAGVHAVALAVVDGQPVGVDLGAAVGRPGPKRGPLGLGDLLDLAEHLAGGRLVDRTFLTSPASRIASRIRSAPRPSTSPVYSGMSNQTRTWHWAPRL